ncbi:PAS domain S-box-containing protein/diguanylate cyclase (GGDEF) domain-containing protein [Mesobacillus persicus]|uniref:PAS domain S-box-containing protein/diguanylate cyclase (GGDEF) domain-containing protein n=1 Tax=Mesobacillus persicus TaxID=930146 RepID=A0A1H7WBR4_9BACI|nr:EAL domain-containing protein [Mesobacillus persicus]SEM18943.1 PAS domain S-box-containing protein/diguanylate cyclase (GGDEF) domain-containing protein [Mesobacillus persicus]
MNLGEPRKKLTSYLNRTESEFYQEMFTIHPDAIYVIDKYGYLMECNKGFFQLTGYKADECIGQPVYQLIHPDDRTKVMNFIQKSFNGKASRRQYRFVQKSGIVKNVWTDAAPIYSEEGKTIGLFIIGKDVTQEKEINEIKLQQEKRFSSLIKNSHDIISIIDENMRLNYQSPSIENVLGYPYEEVLEILSNDLFALMHPDDHELAILKLRDLYNSHNGKLSMELRLKHQNGEWRNFQITGSNLLHDENVNGVVVNYQDITDIKKAQEEVHYMAFHDYLTDLPNRRYLEQKLESELRMKKGTELKLAVMFIDLDQFKFINDTLGHDTGDKVLIEVAQTLKSCVWDSDVVARLAGDEFIILLTNQTSIECVKKIAQKIIEVFERPFNVDQFELFITASIGISLFPDSGEDSKSLMKNADLAMYLAKDNGKNGFQVFTPTMNIKSYKTFTFQNDLRKALKQDQFELYYQPKVCTRTNKIVGAEALIRWKHPEWGMVPPSEFIFLAEESGFIIQIGEWVLRNVCRQIKLWEQEGFEPIIISLNFSVLQILQTDIVQTISTILEDSKISGTLLEIEITESMILEKESEVSNTIDEIRQLGVGVALDDFGTGYSSLGSLRNFNFDTIKLDKSFIRDIHHNEESKAIIKFIINLARELKINVVAEGVEYEEQLTLLRHLECDEIQGYLFSRPKPVEEFEKMLVEKSVSFESEVYMKPENRNDFRISFPYPLEADMTIVELNGKVIQLGKTNVLIEDMGPKGLRFVTDIKLPLDTAMTIKFTTQLFGKFITNYGKLVFQQELGDLYQCGVEFLPHEQNSPMLKKLLTQLEEELKHHPLIEESNFITTNKLDYFINN